MINSTSDISIITPLHLIICIRNGCFPQATPTTIRRGAQCPCGLRRWLTWLGRQRPKLLFRVSQPRASRSAPDPAFVLGPLRWHASKFCPATLNGSSLRPAWDRFLNDVTTQHLAIANLPRSWFSTHREQSLRSFDVGKSSA